MAAVKIKVKLLLIGAIVALQAAAIGIIPFQLNEHYLTTPDAGGWACGAQTIADTGKYSDGHTADLGYNFNICWTEQTYPALQQLLASLVKITGLAADSLVPFTLTLVLIATALTLAAIGWKLSRSYGVTLFAGLAASITPIALRSFILTPQNLFGYWLIAVLLLILIHLLQTKQYWWWLGVVGVAALLGYVHSLSFGVAGLTCAVWFYGWYLPNWKWRLGLLVLGSVGAYAIWQFDLSPVSPQDAWQLFTNGKFPGYDHPLYDHPALLGYGLTTLAVIGLLYNQINERRSYWLLVCWLIVPTLLAHLSIIGGLLMPNRFIAYIWISTALLAALGLERLRTLLPWNTALWIGLAITLWGAQFSHTIVYMKDDIDGWSSRFRPHPAFVEALTWLNQQPDQGALVGIMAVANREITFAPLWYDGPITSYPWYNLNHRNLKSFKANSTLYQDVFSDPASAEYLRVKGFYTIIVKPNSTDAKSLAQQYNLAYLIIPKDSQADVIWQKQQPEQFPQLYENQDYRIYNLR